MCFLNNIIIDTKYIEFICINYYKKNVCKTIYKNHKIIPKKNSINNIYYIMFKNGKILKCMINISIMETYFIIKIIIFISNFVFLLNTFVFII